MPWHIYRDFRNEDKNRPCFVWHCAGASTVSSNIHLVSKCLHHWNVCSSYWMIVCFFILISSLSFDPSCYCGWHRFAFSIDIPPAVLIQLTNAFVYIKSPCATHNLSSSHHCLTDFCYVFFKLKDVFFLFVSCSTPMSIYLRSSMPP